MHMKPEDIIIEDLPEVYQHLSELVGIENMLIIAKAFGGGESIYFPKLEAIHRPARDKQIIEEFNGYNFKQLAKKHGLSEVRVRSIVKDYVDFERNKPAPGQITVFDILEDGY